METYRNSTTFSDTDIMDGGTDMEQRPSSRAVGTQGVPETHNDESDIRQKGSDMMHGMKERAERVSEKVKNKVTSATDYVKNAEAADMWGDVKELARRNPGASMVAVAVIGFVLGRSTSRSHSR